MITTKDNPTKTGRGRPRRSARYQEARESGKLDQFIGDRNELVVQFMRLARKLARKLYGTSFVRRLGDLDDVRQEALLGLIRAAECYDPNHPSSSTAMTYLYTSVTRWLYREGQAAGVIHIPTNVSVEKWDELKTAHVRGLSEVQIDYLQDDRNDEAAAGPDVERVRQMVDLLCDPDRSMVRLYFGLCGKEPTPMWKIGKQFRVSKQAVWLRINRALRTMRDEWEQREQGVVPQHQGEFAFAREGEER